MLTGRFVLCYSCAGEGLDQLAMRNMLVSFASHIIVQAEPVPEVEALVLYSLIIFQNYTAITYKYRAGVDL